MVLFVCMSIPSTWKFFDNAGPAPWWVFFSGGLSVFVYLHLDCVDGKQARRTKSSSPLGQLFDHGQSWLRESICKICNALQQNLWAGDRETGIWCILVCSSPHQLESSGSHCMSNSTCQIHFKEILPFSEEVLYCSFICASLWTPGHILVVRSVQAVMLWACIS